MLLSCLLDVIVCYYDVEKQTPYDDGKYWTVVSTFRAIFSFIRLNVPLTILNIQTVARKLSYNYDVCKF